MKWAYLKYLDLCLPEAMPEGRRTKSFALFDKAKPSMRRREGGGSFDKVTELRDELGN